MFLRRVLLRSRGLPPFSSRPYVRTLASTSVRNYSRGARYNFAALAAAGVVGCLYNYSRNANLSTASCDVQQQETLVPGQYRPDLKSISMSEVASHKTPEDRIWVSYKGGVYDITEFIDSHPGGSSKIMLAAGGSLEPYWNLYAQHKEEMVYEILEEMRIGNLEGGEQDDSDPYAKDPLRNPLLTVRSKKPFNAEPPLELLDSEITPNELFYVRNHLPVPVVDPSTYRLSVEGKDGEALALSLEDLRTKYRKHTVTVTIMCAGNRRNEMDSIKKVKGGYWDAGAISTAKWSGALLSDVLREAGFKEEDVDHLQFEGLDEDKVTHTIYGASVPAEIAFDDRNEVLLAYEMNGEEIPADHGYPVRVVIPGVVGARNVKWLSKIVASGDESTSHWQQNDYKGFHSSIDWHNVDFKTAPAIQELPVTSAVCSAVCSGDDEIEAEGYAYSGGGRGVIRVDVTTDDGKTWISADLSQSDPSQKRNHIYGWTLWKATIPIPEEQAGKTVKVACRAVDSQYNVQPESCEKIWNLRGVLSNSWHSREVKTCA